LFAPDSRACRSSRVLYAPPGRTQESDMFFIGYIMRAVAIILATSSVFGGLSPALSVPDVGMNTTMTMLSGLVSPAILRALSSPFIFPWCRPTIMCGERFLSLHRGASAGFFYSLRARMAGRTSLLLFQRRRLRLSALRLRSLLSFCLFFCDYPRVGVYDEACLFLCRLYRRSHFVCGH